MAGHKFGASGAPALTWAMNTHVPALVAERYRGARIVAFSTGNVYGLVPVGGAGAREATPPMPVGEYAQSCLGRERMFEYFSAQARHAGPHRPPQLRDRHALRRRLSTSRRKVFAATPVDVTMGHVNVIWQGDANAQVLRCLAHCTTPTTPINVTGPETISIRWLAHQLAARLGTRGEGRRPGGADGAALRHDRGDGAVRRSASFRSARMLDWVADWVKAGGTSFGKPTKFEVRDGEF